jgi:hypothetical protein
MLCSKGYLQSSTVTIYLTALRHIPLHFKHLQCLSRKLISSHVAGIQNCIGPLIYAHFSAVADEKQDRYIRVTIMANHDFWAQQHISTVFPDTFRGCFTMVHTLGTQHQLFMAYWTSEADSAVLCTSTSSMVPSKYIDPIGLLPIFKAPVLTESGLLLATVR